jgi:hypothetical protein
MHYRLLLLDRAGDVYARFGLECPDDQTAIKDAVEFATSEGLEVWQETRIVFRRPTADPSAYV